MIEPTQDTHVGGQKFHEAFRWIREATSENIAEEGAYAAVMYTDYVTAELQAKVEQLTADNALLMTSKHEAVDRFSQRIATLEAKLAARNFVPITDEHKDGDDWPLACITRMQGHWTDSWGWVNLDGVKIYPTHAAPLPKPPAKETEL